MIELDEEQLEVAAQRVDSVSTGIKDATDKRGSDSLYETIKLEIDEYVTNPALKRAKDLGEEHVGDRVKYIRPVTGEWKGDVYTAGLTSNNAVVLSHEEGSGSYSSRGPYKIEPKPSSSFEYLYFNNEQGFPIRIKFVVHPGVRGKRFMQRAMRERENELIEDILDETNNVLREAVDPER